MTYKIEVINPSSKPGGAKLLTYGKISPEVDYKTKRNSYFIITGDEEHYSLNLYSPKLIERISEVEIASLSPNISSIHSETAPTKDLMRYEWALVGLESENPSVVISLIIKDSD